MSESTITSAEVDGEIVDAEILPPGASHSGPVDVGPTGLVPAGRAVVDLGAISLSGATARIDRDPAAVYLGRLRGSGKRVMREAVQTFLDVLAGERGRFAVFGFPWKDLEYQHVMAVRAELSTRYAPATANRILAALRGVLKEAWRLRLIDVESYQRLIDFDPVRGNTETAGRYVRPEEVSELLRVCAEDETTHGLRDGAILSILFGAGLRRAEVAALQRADFNAREESLRVRGKGNKVRTAYLPEDVIVRLEWWLEVRGGDPGPLFVPIHKAGKIRMAGLTEQAIYYILRKRIEQARIDPMTPHDARRTFASDLLDAGEDLNTVREMLGHSSVQTTANYDRAAERRKKKAASRIRLGRS